MLCDLEDAEEESFDDADKDGEEKMAEVRRRRREDLLAQIDFDKWVDVRFGHYYY